jgi:hypothetical protein
MAHNSVWISYDGTARVVLALVLLIAAGGAAYAGTRLRLPARAPAPGQKAANFMLAAWMFAITAFLCCVGILIQLARQDHLPHARPPDPITPVTFTAVGATFVIIVLISSSHDWPVRLAGAAIGALAAPMIFEFPFDLIVMARTFPRIPDPALYRVLFFAPLFLLEITTLSLLALSPMVRLSKATFFSFAAILAVFAVWGLSGFGYPSAPLPYALNVVSKILAFAAALSLFLPQRAEASTSRPQPALALRSRAQAASAARTLSEASAASIASSNGVSRQRLTGARAAGSHTRHR